MQKRDPNTPIAERAQERPEPRRKRPASKIRPVPGAHQGAVETDVSPTTPPMSSSDKPGKNNDEIDPTDELTPG